MCHTSSSCSTASECHGQEEARSAIQTRGKRRGERERNLLTRDRLSPSVVGTTGTLDGVFMVIAAPAFVGTLAKLMSRQSVLQVDGLPSEIRAQLKALALARFGKASASLMVRHLVEECLAKAPKQASPKLDLTGEMVRVELRLPRGIVDDLETRSDNRLSARNYYICSLIYRQLGLEQLQGDEIECLRRSNFELSKIGTNVNQIAKAFNLLVKAGDGGRPPEIGKKMASLRAEIKLHINKVLRVLDAGTVLWERKVSERKRQVRKK